MLACSSFVDLYIAPSGSLFLPHLHPPPPCIFAIFESLILSFFSFLLFFAYQYERVFFFLFFPAPVIVSSRCMSSRQRWTALTSLTSSLPRYTHTVAYQPYHTNIAYTRTIAFPYRTIAYAQTVPPAQHMTAQSTISTKDTEPMSKEQTSEYYYFPKLYTNRRTVCTSIFNPNASCI